jgi:CDGSH-type Zn-finger protein
VKQIEEDTMSDVIITPNNDGPYHVKGKFKIVTDGGREIAVDGDETWLCRCGHSASKPFCDGSHKKAAFRNNLDEKS